MNKCPTCGQIVRKINGALVLDKHTCVKPRRKPRRQDAIYRHAQLVYDDIDRSPDSDPNDTERPTF